MVVRRRRRATWPFFEAARELPAGVEYAMRNDIEPQDIDPRRSTTSCPTKLSTA
jgi:hypothetical protein